MGDMICSTTTFMIAMKSLAEQNAAPESLQPTQSSENARPNRRAGLERRWIRAPFNGPERRSGKDRRQSSQEPNPDLKPLCPDNKQTP